MVEHIKESSTNFLFFQEGECYKDRNYPESSRMSMSRNMMFQEFSRTVTHQF